jgi:NAD(P)H-hydrate epimerase
VVIGEAPKMTPDASLNLGIVKRMGLPISVAHDHDAAHRAVDGIRLDDVVVDALLGTGFRGEVRSPLAETIDALNAAPRRAMVAVDLPSGLDCDTGLAASSTIRADLTITFVASKVGFVSLPAASFTGHVEIADIGSPRELLDEFARDRPA